MEEKLENTEIRVHGDIEVRSDEGGLDEVVAKNAWVHLEYVDDGYVWIGITDSHGNIVHVHLQSKKKIKGGAEKIRKSEGSDQSLINQKPAHVCLICKKAMQAASRWRRASSQVRLRKSSR